MNAGRPLLRLSTGDTRKVLNRLPHADLLVLLSDWKVDLSRQPKKGTKKRLIDLLVAKELANGISQDQVADVDFKCLQRRSSRLWHTLRLVGLREGDKKELGSSLQESLRKHLCLFFNNIHVCAKYHRDESGRTLWVRVAFFDEAASASMVPKSSNVVYLVHRGHSEYVFVTAMKAEHKEFLIQSLLASLRCTEIQLWNLTSTNVAGMDKLLLDKACLGKHSVFHRQGEGAMEGTPLAIRPRAKRKRSDSAAEKVLVLSGGAVEVVQEVAKEDAQNRSECRTEFGSAPPPVDRLTFKLRTKMRGAHAVDLPGVFKCSVQFTGPNILQGIQDLGVKGHITLPLPPLLSEYPREGRNTFVVAEDGEQSGDL